MSEPNDPTPNDPTRHPSSGPDTRPDTRKPLPDRRGAAGIVIACDDCAMQCTSTCDDCVVTYVLRVDDEPLEPLTLDVAEERAVRLLVQAGMIPALRYKVAV
jgi:hypothetical protein